MQLLCRYFLSASFVLKYYIYTAIIIISITNELIQCQIVNFDGLMILQLSCMCFLPLQGDSMVIKRLVWDRYVSSYTLRELSTHSHILLYICDEIMKGQKKGKCFQLISSRMILHRKFYIFPKFQLQKNCMRQIITEELHSSLDDIPR